ncbi:hypothetical protein CDL15_Pgr024622 [Punica granatum]|uniref:Uncharacterized protein n=1 Tax=Punica granatum TaxID=22663 RepID=A0A218W8T3_PUNGR|nr:hypothetical protein CDL15_Pgr024622 [Punica granatum]
MLTTEPAWGRKEQMRREERKPSESQAPPGEEREQRRLSNGRGGDAGRTETGSISF